MSTLNVPIQINGGEANAPQLYTRELYLTSNYQLYAGTITSNNETKVSPQPLKVDTANRANRIDNAGATGGDNFWLDANQANFKIGNLNFNASNQTFSPASTGAVTMQGINLTTIPKIVITTAMYGTSAPSGVGENGQLYFRYAQ